MGLLHGMPGDDVNALCQPQERAGPLAERPDGAIEPRSGRDDREASADLDVGGRRGVSDTRADDPLVFAKEVDDPRVIQNEGPA